MRFDRRDYAGLVAAILACIADVGGVLAQSVEKTTARPPTSDTHAVEEGEPTASQADTARATELPLAGSGTSFDARLSTSMWSGNRRLDDESGVLHLLGGMKIERALTASTAMSIDGYLASEEALPSGYSEGGGVLREAYLNFKRGQSQCRLGLQIFAWGRADVVNPTDNVSAVDYSLLSESDAEQKLGVFAANFAYRFDSIVIQALWQPIFRRSVTPLPRLEGFRYVTNDPAGARKSGGVRLEFQGESVAWALSYFRGHAKGENLAPDPDRAAQGLLDTNHPMTDTLGFDVEALAGRWVFRGEVAYNSVEGSGSSVLASRESFLFGVAGVERDFGKMSAFAQISVRRVFDYQDPSLAPEPLTALAIASATLNEEGRRSSLGLGAGVTYGTSDMRWTWSIAVGHLPGTKEISIRPRLKYQISDTASCWIGGDWFGGAREGAIGRLHENSVVFAGLTWSFSRQAGTTN